MADTGVKTAGAINSVGNWTDFTVVRLGTSDNSRTQHNPNPPAPVSYGIVYNFAFGLPDGAQIDGIEFIIEGAGAPGARDLIMSLSWDMKGTWTATKTQTMPTSEADRTFGGATDKWGRSAWTVNELADGTFFLRVIPAASGSNAVVIDYLRGKIYYTLPSGGFFAFL